MLGEIRSANGTGVTEGQAAAAEKTLRDVLMHMRTHDGKIPSQHEADSRKLYFQFGEIQSRPAVSDTAQSLLDEIRSANGPGVTAGQAAAAEKTLRDVLMHLRTHDGKIPSQHEADLRKLYFQFGEIQSRPAVSDTAQSLLAELRFSTRLDVVTALHLSLIQH